MIDWMVVAFDAFCLVVVWLIGFVCGWLAKWIDGLSTRKRVEP